MVEHDGYPDFSLWSDMSTLGADGCDVYVKLGEWIKIGRAHHSPTEMIDLLNAFLKGNPLQADMENDFSISPLDKPLT